MSDAVQLSIQQFVGAWHLMCTAAPGHSRASAPGIEYIFAGIPVPFFNVAILTARGISASALRQMGVDVCAWAGPSGLPYLLILTHETLEPGVDPAVELASSGLVPMLPLTGMAAGRVAPAPSLNNGFRLTYPDDDAGCSALLNINAAAYGLPLDDAKPMLGSAAFWRGKVLVIGESTGTPVASTAVLPVDGCRYVALVATQPGHQRRGYAEAVMRAALEQSETRFGDSITTLHATDAGRPVYERMGYSRLASHTAYIEQRFLEGH